MCNQLFLVLTESVNRFLAEETDANSQSRMHLAKPFVQLYQLKMVSDYPVIGAFQGSHTC